MNVTSYVRISKHYVTLESGLIKNIQVYRYISISDTHQGKPASMLQMRLYERNTIGLWEAYASSRAPCPVFVRQMPEVYFGFCHICRTNSSSTTAPLSARDGMYPLYHYGVRTLNWPLYYRQSFHSTFDRQHQFQSHMRCHQKWDCSMCSKKHSHRRAFEQHCKYETLCILWKSILRVSLG